MLSRSSLRPLFKFSTRLPFVTFLGLFSLVLLGLWYSGLTQRNNAVPAIAEEPVGAGGAAQEEYEIETQEDLRYKQIFRDKLDKIPKVDVHETPNDIPVNKLGYNAVVLYLISHSRIRELVLSLKYLYKNVPMQPWPILLFYAEDMEDPRVQMNILIHLQNALGSDDGVLRFMQRLEFVPTNWSLPPGISHDKNVVKPVWDPWWPGYHLMCGFFATEIFEHPRMQNVTYYIRLDTDSYIFEPSCYDPFELLHSRNKSYGFRSTMNDPNWVVVGLWDLVDAYASTHPEVERTLERNGFKWPTPRGQGKMNEEKFSIYYNNFEVIKLEAFRRPEVRAWFEEIKKDPEHIYKYRWGGAPVRYATVNMLFDVKNEVEEFCGLKYWHNGVRGRKCDCEAQKAGRT